MLNVLACATILLHSIRSLVFLFQFLILITFRSSTTSSSHLLLGLPWALVPKGFHLYIRLTNLSSGSLCTCPNHLNLCAWIKLIMFWFLIILYSSLFLLSLQVPSISFIGPYILLNIFLSNTSSFCLSDSLRTHVSHAQVTTGLIIVWYNLDFAFLDTSLLLNSAKFAK